MIIKLFISRWSQKNVNEELVLQDYEYGDNIDFDEFDYQRW